MTLRSLVVICCLIVSIAGLAAAKSYYFTLAEPAVVGTNELKAGDYEVKVEGTQVVVTDQVHGKSFKLAATLEHSDRRFDGTAVESTSKDGKDRILAITLGGSNTRVVLGQ